MGRCSIGICVLIVANVAFMQLEATQVTLDAKGIIAPVFTPVDRNNKVKLSIIPQYAQYLKDNGVDGVLVVGTTGEATTLTLNERKRLINAWVDAAGPLGLYIIVQVGGIPLPYAIELATFVDKIGVSAILFLAELYYTPKTVRELVYNLEFIARAAPNTPLLYDDDLPNTINVDIVEFFLLATEIIPTFKGINTYSLSTALKLEDLLIDDQRIFIEDPVYLAPAALTGYKNFILTVINYLPKLVDAIVKNGVNGYRKTTKSQYRKLNDIRDAIIEGVGNNLAAQKAAMPFLTGLDLGNIRPPQVPLTNEQKNGIKERLRRKGVKIVDGR